MEEKNVKRNQTNKKSINNKSVVIKDKKKFCIFIAIVALVIIVIVLLICLNKKVDISNVNDYTSLNALKYSNELLAKYQSEESKNKFLEDYDQVQGAVGIYIIENSTNSPDSFVNIIKELKNILEKEDFDKLAIDKPNFWNGTWNVNDEGIVSFKFGDQKIEPTWISEEEIETKIEKN